MTFQVCTIYLISYGERISRCPRRGRGGAVDGREHTKSGVEITKRQPIKTTTNSEFSLALGSSWRSFIDFICLFGPIILHTINDARRSSVSNLVYVQLSGLSRKRRILTLFAAPAISSVSYQHHQFDLPAVPEGKFVGKGPEVDAAWDYITDSSTSNLPVEYLALC